MTPPSAVSHKRKRVAEQSTASEHLRRKALSSGDDDQARILLLESQIGESRRYYNNIVELIKLAKNHDTGEVATLATVALCRVFCRLLIAGNMKKTKHPSESETMIIRWLRERYNEYIDTLLQDIECSEPTLQSTTLTLIMRMVKAETTAQNLAGDEAWKNGIFYQLVRILHASAGAENARGEFVEMYMRKYDDIRFYTLIVISLCLKNYASPAEQEQVIASSLSTLSNIDSVAELNPAERLASFYGPEPEGDTHQLRSLSSHKRQGQNVWLALLRSGLNKDQRKTVLLTMTYTITPWFSKVELLMDFLTDSYNVGGSTSLLALSGLFYLIRKKNLDYPSFYTKLYSLLDDGILHSKHRSKFCRLLDEFMASTHLPAALVASFIKRLSRLSLHAPPAGIVVVVPWVYNMLMKHPACTFMIHRVTRDANVLESLEECGMDDPFNMEEPDPMATNAIESSLWELETLQTHYHPSVATLAKIISEQFTKRSYNLEDFLNHSYSGLIEAEFAKEMKKVPVVEYEIPKRIFTAEGSGLGPLGGLLTKVLESCH